MPEGTLILKFKNRLNLLNISEENGLDHTVTSGSFNKSFKMKTIAIKIAQEK